MDLAFEEHLGSRGPVLREFLIALSHWEDHYKALGKHKDLGYWRLPWRRQHLDRARDTLRLLARHIGSLRGNDVIIRFNRRVQGRITGGSAIVTFRPGDYIFRFLSEPVIDEQIPFALPLRFTPTRHVVGEIELLATPGDIDSLYILEA